MSGLAHVRGRGKEMKRSRVLSVCVCVCVCERERERERGWREGERNLSLKMVGRRAFLGFLLYISDLLVLNRAFL